MASSYPTFRLKKFTCWTSQTQTASSMACSNLITTSRLPTWTSQTRKWIPKLHMESKSLKLNYLKLLLQHPHIWKQPDPHLWHSCWARLKQSFSQAKAAMCSGVQPAISTACRREVGGPRFALDQGTHDTTFTRFSSGNGRFIQVCVTKDLERAMPHITMERMQGGIGQGSIASVEWKATWQSQT